ncbi:MAG TPA: response regulator [Conexibacter sp.]
MTRSVLVVDDDPVFLSLVTRILASIGIVGVTTAQDGVTALAAADVVKPDAILVDVGLPDCDGIDLAFVLQALPWEPHVTVTSSDDDAAFVVAARANSQLLPFVRKDEVTSDSMRRLTSCTAQKG